MWTDKGTHYVLGRIIFKEEIIFIMDSKLPRYSGRAEEFKILAKIASACMSTAGKLKKPEEWLYMLSAVAFVL